MKPFAALLFVALAAQCFGQESNLLGKCLGKPLAAYNQAFSQNFVNAVTTPKGSAKAAEFKTGSASIKVFQFAKPPIVTEILVGFYQVPTLTWQKALEELGISTSGVQTKSEGGKVHLYGIKAAPNVTIDALFDPKSTKNFDNPSLSIAIKKR